MIELFLWAITENPQIQTGLPIGNIFSAVAVVISIISLFISYKSYNLSKISEIKTCPIMKYYLADKMIILKEDKRIYFFRVRVSNLSRSNNAISNSNLVVNYKKGKRLHSIRIDSKWFSLNKDYTSTNLPHNIEAGNTISVTIMFELEESFSRNEDIKDYELIFSDTFNNEQSIGIALLNEVTIND